MADAGEIPILRSERLILRPHREGDLDAAAAMWADEAVIRHIGGAIFTREQVWHRILRYLGHWTIRPYGYWAIVEVSSGRFLGEIGIADWKRDGVRQVADPEAGWALIPSAHGRGFASEAMRSMLNWADSNGMTRIACIIRPENAASIRLAKRFGFNAVPSENERGASLLFVRLRPDGSSLVHGANGPST